MKVTVGVDVGSISAKLAAIRVEGERFEFQSDLAEESSFWMASRRFFVKSIMSPIG
jgi:hypothetical protein